ncbi:MAG: multiple sugar transport system substrate-binding protein [Clostridiales bacterium]|nr:multiple sugar transport system substrate-binding protein [Clostridiales bacterium]
METLQVLAVSDPAVNAYVEKNLLDGYEGRVTMEIVPWESYFNTMMDAFKGRAAYDIVMVAGHLWKRDFIEKGYLTKIEYVTEDNLTMIDNEMKWRGAHYLAPAFCDGHMIVYRKSLVREVLGELPGISITPEEYVIIAKKLALAGYPIAMKAAPSEIFTDALPFLRRKGIDVYDATGHIQCEKQEIIDGLNLYLELKRAAIGGTHTFGNEEIEQLLQKKEVPMAVTWSGQMGCVMNKACIEPEDMGFATFTTAWNVTWSFAVCETSTKKEEAFRFLSYLNSEEIDWRAGMQSGAPVKRASYERGLRIYPWYLCQMNMFERARPLPDICLAGEKNGILYEKITSAFRGEKTAAQAMQEAQREIEKLEE